MDADLVKIESERENNFIKAELQKLHPGKRMLLLLGSDRAWERYYLFIYLFIFVKPILLNYIVLSSVLRKWVSDGLSE